MSNPPIRDKSRVQEVRKLLDIVEKLPRRESAAVAYYHLVEYEDAGFEDHPFADKLLDLCISVLNDLRRKKKSAQQLEWAAKKESKKNAK